MVAVSVVNSVNQYGMESSGNIWSYRHLIDQMHLQAEQQWDATCYHWATHCTGALWFHYHVSSAGQSFMEISEWDTLSIISEVFSKMLSVGGLATYYLCIGLPGGKCMEKLTQKFIECGQYYTKHDLESLIHVATLISVAGCVCVHGTYSICCKALLHSNKTVIVLSYSQRSHYQFSILNFSLSLFNFSFSNFFT